MQKKKAHGYKYVSMNEFLYDELDKIADDRKTRGLPHRTVSDILNLMSLYYLLEVAPNTDLRAIQALLEKKEKSVHKAVQSIIKDVQKPAADQDS